MTTVDSTGLQISYYSDIVAEMEDGLVAYFGDGVKTIEQSVFGQLIKRVALIAAELNTSLQELSEMFDPNSASGLLLAKMCLLVNVVKNEYAYSTVSLVCTANSAGLILPAGSIASTQDGGIKVKTDVELIVAPNQTGYVSATATKAGAIEIEADTLTKIDTPVYGWSLVNNPAAGTTGMEEETSAELRTRRNSVVSQAGSSSIAKIYGEVSNVSGVSHIWVGENYTDELDDNGILPHHIWVVVKGGSDALIAAQIFEHKGGGIPMMGSTLVSHMDATMGKEVPIRFTRPTEKRVYIAITLEKYDDFPATGEADIKTSLAAFFASGVLGGDVISSRLYTPVNSVVGHKIVYLYIGLSPTPSSAADIPIDIDELAILYSTDDITIAEI